MFDLKSEVAQFLIDSDVIVFGSFQLKSGRESPYFFNFGKLSSASLINKLAWFYARFIIENDVDPKVIFGPAYKGIPLAVAIAISLQRDFGVDVDFSFNRKEYKCYGDSGILIGSALDEKSVIIVDDVITSGLTIDDSVNLVRSMSGIVISYLVALDRKEKILMELNRHSQAHKVGWM